MWLGVGFDPLADQDESLKVVKPALGLLMISLVVITSHGLVTGSPWLTSQLLGLLPLGNLAVACSLIAVALFNQMYLSRGPLSLAVAWLASIAALMWYPTGIIWSGNLWLRFDGNGDGWLPFSFIVTVVCVLTLLINLIMHCVVRPLFRSKV